MARTSPPQPADANAAPWPADETARECVKSRWFNVFGSRGGKPPCPHPRKNAL